MRYQGRARARRLAVMAVAAVLLATVVASSLSGGPPPGDPRASFTFDVDDDTVLVRHYGGDSIDGSNLVVESGQRGRLGTFDGSEGMACERNVTRATVSSVCRVPDAAHERLFVVWENRNNRSLILARRAPDPALTDAPTNAPTTLSPTGTPSPTGVPATTAEPTATVPTATVPTPTGTPTLTPSPTPVPTSTPTATAEPNSVLPTDSTPTNATISDG